MASGFRGLCRLAAVISLRRSAPSVLPQGRNLTTVSLPPASRIANTSKLRPPSVFQTRCYADTLTGPELTERVLTVLKTFDKIDPTKVTLEAHFINDYGLDSLDIVEIVMAFENEFGIEIDDEQAEKIFTANDAITFLTKEMGIH